MKRSSLLLLGTVFVAGLAVGRATVASPRPIAKADASAAPDPVRSRRDHWQATLPCGAGADRQVDRRNQPFQRSPNRRIVVNHIDDRA